MIDNDVNVVGWVEYCFGVGCGVIDMIMFMIGMGVGGVVIVDGYLLCGGFGMVGEIGYLCVVLGGLFCGCG